MLRHLLICPPGPAALVLFLAGTALGEAGAPDRTSVILPSADAPYPASTVIGGLQIDWSTHQRGAMGSDNFMMTWADDDHQYGAWGDGGGFGGILQFGRDYHGARDGYVYHYMLEAKQPDASNDELQTPGRVILLRVPKDRLMERSAYEVFAGGRGGPAHWSKRLSERRPVLEDPSGIGTPIGISYHPGLQRYLLCAEHGEPHSGSLAMFEAPEPWGPWSTVVYLSKSKGTWFGQNNAGEHDVPPNGFFWHFPTKWMDASGRELSLNFTGGGRGQNNDSFNTVRVRLLPAGDH